MSGHGPTRGVAERFRASLAVDARFKLKVNYVDKQGYIGAMNKSISIGTLLRSTHEPKP